MANDSDTVQSQASRYCALCRKSLLDPQHDPHQVPAHRAWEYRVLAFCDGSRTNGPSGIVATPADLAHPVLLSKLPVISRSQRTFSTLDISFASACQLYEIDNITHLIHLYCWKLVNKSMKTQPAISSIYMFARSTYPLFDTIHAEGRLPDLTNAVAGQNARTDMGRLLKSLSKLPVEIRLAILAYCAQTLLSSLLMAVESSLLLELVKQESPSQSTVDLDCHAAVETISAHSISILGQSYISLLSFNSSNFDMKGQSLVAVKRLEIKGIKFVLDRYGLRAISILYADNSTSPWLGDNMRGWKGVLYGDNLRGLRIIKDDLKYLRVDFAQNNARAGHPVMWDKELHFLSNHTHQILDTVSNRPQARHFPGWRLCYHLPLIGDRGYISGLTIYCHQHGITGMIAHGQSSTLIGYRQGCPIHLHLYRDERITSVWLRTPGDSFDIMAEPTMLVTTTYNRTCTFGPYLSFDVTRIRQYGWTKLCESPNSGIFGLFFDALSVSPLHQVTSIGVTRDLDAGPSLVRGNIPRVLVARSTPVIDTNIATGLFISVGTFRYIQRLEIRKVGTRCTGLCIHHSDNTIECLGQWDPSHYSTISDIYRKDEGMIASINFRLSGSTESSYVEDITIGLIDEEPIVESCASNTKVFFMNQSIAWWFTKRYDCLLLWDGTSEEITVSAPKHRIMYLV